MQILFRQNTKSGCGSYCLANLFNDKSFLDDVPELQVGEFVAKLNRKLDKYQPDFYMTGLFLTNSQFPLQHNKLLDEEFFGLIKEVMTDEEKTTFRPFFLSIKGAIRFHYILACQRMDDGMIYVFDSLKEDRQIFTAKELIENYFIVQVDTLGNWNFEDPDMVLLLKKSFFPHLFTENEITCKKTH